MDIIAKTIFKKDYTYELVKYPLKQLFVIDNLYSVSYHEFSLTYDSKGDHHDFWEIVYIDRGEVTVMADNAHYTLYEGQLMMYSPNTPHSFKAKNNTAPNTFILTFDSDSKYLHFFKNTVISLNLEEKRLLSDIMKAAESSFEMGVYRNNCMVGRTDAPPGSLQMIKLRLEELMILFLQRHSQINNKTASDKQSKLLKERRLSEKIMEYMERNVEKTISLNELAENFSVSVSQIKKLFKAETGKTVKDCFMDKKIGYAKKAIRETGVSYTIIAKNLGFSSVHHFSATFKKKTGLTPSEYDKSIRN